MDNFTLILPSYPEKKASPTLYLLRFCERNDRAEWFKCFPPAPEDGKVSMSQKPVFSSDIIYGQNP